MAATSEESPSSLVYNSTVPPGFNPTRNYTGQDEKGGWWYLKRWSKDWKSCYHHVGQSYYTSKAAVRTRRKFMLCLRKAQALRIRCEKSDEIGAFIRLTNTYCLLCCGEDSEHFLNTIKGDLGDMPVINTTLAGCRVVGRMCVGNSKGLLVPDTLYDTEMEQIKNQLPDSVKVEKLEERLSALGNVITCNDKVALIHPDIDRDTEQIIADTLQVEVFRHMIGNNPLVGSYCVLNNNGGLVQPEIAKSELENLSSLLQLRLVAGTVNRGSKVLASGMVANDWIAYAGMKTTSYEFSVMEDVFNFTSCPCSERVLQRS